ncbi:PLVAP protein, partial [Alectura lathami]|nr:PLVAP protein [Alectura lathami]
MEKSSYTMAKFGLEAKEAMPKRDCGFYMKYVFLFTSLIQFLIILGLVLFMVYGNAHAGTDKHLQTLEEQLQDRYNKIIILSGRNANLTRTLNATLKEKQALQGQLAKVQQELNKCNSSQATNATPKPQEIMGIILYQKMELDECHVTISLINASCSAEKAQLRSQLDQTALVRKELGDSCTKTSTALAKATQEQEGCKQDLENTRAFCSTTEIHLEQQKHECSRLRADVSYPLQRIKETLSPYSCSSVHEQLGRLTQQVDGLFTWQQERSAKYVWKDICERNLQQCRYNCSREKQELDRRLQEADKQLKGGQEEKKKLLAEKEQLSKELGEKSKAALQANYFKEQLNLCLGSKVNSFFDIPGSRVPGSSVRPGPFAGTSSYVDVLRNPSIFANMGKTNTEEMQRLVQKITEQYKAMLMN